MAGLTDASIFSKLAGFVSGAAPLLGSALGSPLAGVAVSLISAAFGGKSTSPDDLLASVIKDPDAVAKLREIENKHQEALLQIQASTFQSEVADKASARNMRIALKDHVPDVLAILYLGIYAFIQYHILAHDVPSHDVISARAQDVLMLVFSFYFGSMFKKS